MEDTDFDEGELVPDTTTRFQSLTVREVVEGRVCVQCLFQSVRSWCRGSLLRLGREDESESGASFGEKM